MKKIKYFIVRYKYLDMYFEMTLMAHCKKEAEQYFEEHCQGKLINIKIKK